jgi:hypothetical protein
MSILGNFMILSDEKSYEKDSQMNIDIFLDIFTWFDRAHRTLQDCIR